MYSGVSGKVALVTGAASGIGKATAQLLSANGARVAVTDTNASEAAAVVEAMPEPGRAFAVSLDVTSEAQWESVNAQVISRWGRLDICVNCAGIAVARGITDLSLSEWRQVMATNLDGVFLGTRFAMRQMRKGSGGCIINIASAAGARAVPNNAAYGASKAAIRFFTKVAALEGARHNIRVNSISPGAVATYMWQTAEWWPSLLEEKGGQEAALQALVTEKGFAPPADIAHAVLYLASDEARFINGADLAIDAGFTAGS